MGVQHLNTHAAAAAKANGSIAAMNAAGGPRPTTANKPMPGNSKVSAYSHVALKAAGKTATQHPKGGARVGMKTSQPMIGKRMSGSMGKTYPNGNGGRAS